MRLTALIFAAVVLAAAPAIAQTDEPSAPQTEIAPAATGGSEDQTAAPPPQEEPLVCRTVRQRTESRLRSRREQVCRTQAEWDAQDGSSTAPASEPAPQD